MTQEIHHDDLDCLKVVHALEEGFREITPEVRQAAASAILTLLIKNEELTAKLGNHRTPPWLDALREKLLPQFKVHLETKSGPWPQATETVFIGSSAQDNDALFLKAFAKLTAGKLPDGHIEQWRMLEVTEYNHFAGTSVSRGLHPNIGTTI